MYKSNDEDVMATVTTTPGSHRVSLSHRVLKRRRDVSSLGHHHVAILRIELAHRGKLAAPGVVEDTLNLHCAGGDLFPRVVVG